MSQHDSPLLAKSIDEFCVVVRQREGKSTREFADITGVGFTQISKAENGVIKLPIAYLRALVEFCSEKELRHLLSLILEL